MLASSLFLLLHSGTLVYGMVPSMLKMSLSISQKNTLRCHREGSTVNQNWLLTSCRCLRLGIVSQLQEKSLIKHFGIICCTDYFGGALTWTQDLGQAWLVFCHWAILTVLFNVGYINYFLKQAFNMNIFQWHQIFLQVPNYYWTAKTLLIAINNWYKYPCTLNKMWGVRGGVHTGLHMHARTCRGQKRALYPLKLKLQAVVSHLMWRIKTKPRASAKAANVLNC